MACKLRLLLVVVVDDRPEDSTGVVIIEEDFRVFKNKALTSPCLLSELQMLVFLDEVSQVFLEREGAFT